MVSRWDVLDAHERATAGTAAAFLERVVAQMPFAVKAIQVDGGSELRRSSRMPVEIATSSYSSCRSRSPKLNGSVESARRTHTEECPTGGCANFVLHATDVVVGRSL